MKIVKTTVILLAFFIIPLIGVYAFFMLYTNAKAARAENQQAETSSVFLEETVNNTVISLQVGSPVIIICGQEQFIDERGTVPVIQNGRALIPIRAVIEAMNGTVEWDGEIQTVILTHGENVIQLKKDSDTAYLNDVAHTLDAVPEIINNSTMLPVRFIAESLGFKVDWDDSTSTITITDSNLK